MANSLVSQSNLITNTNTNMNMNNHGKSSQGKSVYESVLEERRNKKYKNSRIVWYFKKFAYLYLRFVKMNKIINFYMNIK